VHEVPGRRKKAKSIRQVPLENETGATKSLASPAAGVKAPMLKTPAGMMTTSVKDVFAALNVKVIVSPSTTVRLAGTKVSVTSSA
jgi:hypothetical protein